MSIASQIWLWTILTRKEVKGMEPKDEPWRWIREIQENISGLSEFCFNCGWHEIENGKCLGCNVVAQDVYNSIDC